MKRTREFVEGKTIMFKGMKCHLKLSVYASGRIYLELHSDEPGVFNTRITLDAHTVPVIENMFILKSYLDNKGIYEALLESGIILPSERAFDVGNYKAYICFLNIPDEEPLKQINKEQLN